jgi:hypothetical protein
MQRHHRDRDMLWLTSGQPFLSWAADLADKARPQDPRQPDHPGPAEREAPKPARPLH